LAFGYLVEQFRESSVIRPFDGLCVVPWL